MSSISGVQFNNQYRITNFIKRQTETGSILLLLVAYQRVIFSILFVCITDNNETRC